MPEPSKIGVVMSLSRRIWISHLGSLSLFVLGARSVGAQTPSPALLVLEKSANTLAIVDSATLKIVGRLPAGPDPHEVEASPDGKLAYISNYGGSDSTLHTISVVDLTAQKALPPIDLGALHSPHGLAASCISLRKRTRSPAATILPRRPLIGW
jgi:DNA-binding beta-propeller fold protein YncE